MYNRRLLIFLCLVGGCVLVAVGRLAQMQLVNGEYYVARAERAMCESELLGTSRGRILDRRGQVLAMEQPCYEFCMDYRALAPESDTGRYWARQQAASIARKENIPLDQAYQRLNDRIEWTKRRAVELTGRPREELDRNSTRVISRVARIRRGASTQVTEEKSPHAVLQGLDETQAVALRSQLGFMAGASIQPGTRRWYPFGDLACHVIGQMGQVSAPEQQNDPHEGDLLRKYLDGELSGKSGVEKMCEEVLRGVRGRRTWRRTGEELEKISPELGVDVRLTLDMDLQRQLTQLLLRDPANPEDPNARRKENGAAVVIDVRTGEVLAMVSVPTYNINTFRADYPKLSTDHVNLPLLNRAIARGYPPGSCVKPVTALAGAAERLIAPETEFNCQGYLHTPTALRCWTWNKTHTGHGSLNMTGAIQHSCNVYFYRLGERLGAQRLLKWMRLMGLGSLTGIGLPEETAGLVPTAEWLWRREHRVFYPADASLSAIGQAQLLATPVQMATLMSTIARDGAYLPPRLVAEGMTQPTLSPAQPHPALPGGALRAVKDGMYMVVNDPRGTAYEPFNDPRVHELKICGKTGTAQVPRQWVDSNHDGQVDEGDFIRTGDMAWFSGFAPRDNPKIAFSIVLEYVESGGGGSNCGPLARDLVLLCKQMGYMD